MKSTFLTLSLMLMLAFTATAQRFFDIQSSGDTLVNRDTIIYLTTHNGGPLNIDVPYEYSVHVKTDSISGANDAVVYLQFSNHRSGSVWYTAQTLTSDGTGSDEALWEGTMKARRMRIYCITPNATARRIKVHCYAIFKRTN